jgi:phospholipid-binding lipoprotein MlaA
MEFLMAFNLKKFLLLATLSVSLTACSSTSNTDGGVHDPFEGFNRGVYKFNDVVDTVALEPIARGYRAAVPQPARTGVRNALRNLKSPTIIANDLLQGNIGGACDSTTRFLANTLFGLGGTIDVAGKEGLTYREEDFGQTLGVWGAGHGAYLILPFFGPSSVRDGTGLAVDMATDVYGLWARNSEEYAAGYGRTLLGAVDKREELLEVLADLKKNSIDSYAATKSAYVQRRASLAGTDLSDAP